MHCEAISSQFWKQNGNLLHAYQFAPYKYVKILTTKYENTQKTLSFNNIKILIFNHCKKVIPALKKGIDIPNLGRAGGGEMVNF